MNKQTLIIDWDAQSALLLNHQHTPHPPRVLLAIYQSGGNKIEGHDMKYTALFMQVLLLGIAAVADAFGNAVDISTVALTWESSDESIATVTVNADGTVSATPTGKAGTAQISVRGDSDPNTPEFFQGMIDITWLPGEASVVTLQVLDNAPAPVPEPAPEPLPTDSADAATDTATG